MIAHTLKEIAEHIDSKTGLFDTYFFDVILDEETGYIYKDIPVFPNDTLGDYFYLRLNKGWRFSPPSNGYGAVSDDIAGLIVAGNVTLVAVVIDADENLLLSNIINALREIRGVQVSEANTQIESVLSQELKGLSKESKLKALQNFNERNSLISISFSYSKVFPYDSCQNKPCKIC